jgi:hypothetical protein
MPAEMFSYFPELSNSATRTVDSFTVTTQPYRLPSGTWVLVTGGVSWNDGMIAQLVVTVSEPVGFPPDSLSILYHRRVYSYQYKNDAAPKIINPCTHSLLDFLSPRDIVSVTVTGNTFTRELPFNPTTTSIDGPAPVVPVPIAGSCRIGLGRTINNDPVYLAEDQWLHNSQEVVVEVAAEIIGNDTFGPDANGYVARVVPLTFEFALQRGTVGGTSGTFEFIGNLDHSPFVYPQTISNILSWISTSEQRIRLSLQRVPNCSGGGQLLAEFLEFNAVVLGAENTNADISGQPTQFAIKTNRDIIPGTNGLNAAGSIVSLGGFVVFHDATPPLVTPEFPAVSADFTIGRRGFFPDPSGSPSRYNPAIHFYGDRLKKCAVPPCDPIEDVFDASGVIPILPVPATISPGPQESIANLFTGRVYRTITRPFPDGPLIDLSSYVEARVTARILSIT